MALCECKKKAVIDVRTPMCKEHFIEFFEDKVEQTIHEFDLFSNNSKIAVAASGGKDSTTLLYLIKKLHGNITAIAIDEGIHDYRDKNLDNLKKFCSKENIELKIYSFKDYTGLTLDEALKHFKLSPCHVCGIWRRYLINKAAREYDVLATGHNLDDEAQSVVMNMMKSNLKILARLGPVSGNIKDPKFTSRVKPLYFIHEKEVAVYALLKGFLTDFTECPNAKDSFRSTVRDELNDLEKVRRGSKERIVRGFLNNLDSIISNNKDELSFCSQCQEPTKESICNSCKLLNKLAAV